jgi:hypothetical protein
MKFSKTFKLIFFTTVIGLYLTGLIVWILDRWGKVDHGFGPEPTAAQIWLLKSHSIVGLIFFVIFGYLIHSHIRPALWVERKIKSGFSILGPTVLLMLTVPGLFYLTDDNQKHMVALIHTYVGLAILLPFLVHLLTRVKKKKPYSL